MTTLLLLAYLGLQAAVIVLRYRLFRIDGRTPAGVRLVEATTLACIVTGTTLVATRTAASPWADGAALVVAAAAAGLLAWTSRSVRPRQLTAVFSTDVPTELISHGPYRHVRNPFYVAYILGHGVPVLATGSPLSLVAWIVMCAIYSRAAVLEERKFLASPLADRYRRYALHTGRFLPRWRVGRAAGFAQASQAANTERSHAP